MPLDFDMCRDAISVQSNPADTEIIDLQVTKSASRTAVFVGDNICYTVTVFNNSDVDLEELAFSDVLMSNLAYVEGSFEVDGVAVTPTISPDNELSYLIPLVAGGATVVVTFCVTVTSLTVPA